MYNRHFESSATKNTNPPTSHAVILTLSDWHVLHNLKKQLNGSVAPTCG